MTTWAKRIKVRMKELGMTQEMLAKKMGVTRGAVTHYLAGRRVPPLRQFQKLATILKVNPAWLQFGTLVEGNQHDKKLIMKKEKHESAKNRIPLLSWEQVAEFFGATRSRHDEVKEYLPDFYANNSDWYALRINGDAMTAPLGNSKSFYEGDVIIVDPDKEAIHGNFVIALLPRSKELTFKQYVVDAGIRYLKPLNPQYPLVQIDESTQMYGVVVASLNQF